MVLPAATGKTGLETPLRETIAKTRLSVAALLSNGSADGSFRLERAVEDYAPSKGGSGFCAPRGRTPPPIPLGGGFDGWPIEGRIRMGPSGAILRVHPRTGTSDGSRSALGTGSLYMVMRPTILLVGKMDEPEITTMGEKGQVVIPQALRRQMGVEPKTKFIVFGQGDTIVLKRLQLPDVRKEWEKVFAAADKKGKVSEADVAREVEAHRGEKRRRTKS